jgi:hypothetical protein
VSSGCSATFFAASKQRNSNSVQGIFMYSPKPGGTSATSVQGIFMYEKFNRNFMLKVVRIVFWSIPITALREVPMKLNEISQKNS